MVKEDRRETAPPEQPAAADASPSTSVLERLGLDDPEVRKAFDRLSLMAARFLDARQAMVTLVLGDRHFILGQCGTNPELVERAPLPLYHTFCDYLVHHPGVHQTADDQDDARFAGPAFMENYRSHVGISLMVGGDSVGTLCISDEAGRQWDLEDVEAVQALAHSVQTELQLRLDIERRRRDEATLREQADLLDLAHDAIIVRSPQDTIIYWNRGAADIFGWEAREVSGKNSHEVLSTRFPEPLARIREKMAETGQWEGDLRCLTRDGDERVMATRWALHRDEKGEVTAILEISRDITLRRQAEEALRHTNARLEQEVMERTEEVIRSEARFRALIEQSSEVITIVSTDGDILYSSPSLERVLGYSPEERMNRPALDLVHPSDRSHVADALRRTAETGQPVAVEYRYKHANGTWRVLQSVALNLVEEPSVRGLVVNTRDVTDLREGEEHLRRAQKMEAIGRLAGGIAHDFNNVLSIITSIAQLMMMDLPEDSPLRSEIREIDHAANRGATLTRQLLAFSRRQVLQPKELELNEVIRGVETLLRRSLGSQIEFETDLDRHLSSILADPAQIEQILLNLAVNAADAMPEGGRLSLATTNLELQETITALDGDDIPAGEWVRLSVADTGIGMSREVMSQIFEPFFTTKSDSKGTGLGLSTVYGIIKQSGGNIMVLSEPGLGTTFEIYFPVKESVDRYGEEGRPPTEGPLGTIVLVETDETQRRIAQTALVDAGYGIRLADSVEEAASILRQDGSTIRLVVADDSELRTATADTIDQIRAARPRTRLIVTSTEEADLLPSASDLNPGGKVLRKPYAARALLDRVAEAVSTRPSRQVREQRRRIEQASRILIVDDEKAIVDMLARTLRKAGHEVVTASGIEQAREIMATDRWDLVITDLRLLDGSGLELLEHIQTRWADTSTILISGDAEASDAAVAIKYGIDRLFLKPIDLDELRVSVEKVLAERRARIRAGQVGRQLQDALRERQRESRIWLLRSAHALVAAVESKDAYTAGHSTRVTAYAKRIARETGGIDLEAFQLAGDLHDVGKIGVPDAVLNKPGSLTREEFAQIRAHPEEGERILRPLIRDPMVLSVVRSHHERWDGQGYPDGLSGEEIPFAARVLAVADTMDAMTSSRAYRVGMTFEVMLAEIRRCAGTQFDPELVRVVEGLRSDLEALHQGFAKGTAG